MAAYTGWTVELETSGLTINTNPLFESGAADWTAINGATLAQSSTYSHQGTNSLRVTPNGVTGNPAARSTPVAITVGRTYAGSMWVLCSLSTGWSFGVSAVIDWTDAGGTTTSSTFGAVTGLSFGVWTQFTVSGTAPVGAVKAALRLRYNGTPGATVITYMDEARLTDSTVSWTDITSYIDRPNAPVRIEYGREDEYGQITPTTCTIVLSNADHRWLPGNQYSALWPCIRKGTRVRVSVTANATTFRRCLVYINDVQPSVYAEPGLDQTVTLTCVDRLAVLGRMPALRSPLYQEIRYTGGSALQAYYPLDEQAGSTQAENATATVRQGLVRQQGLRSSSTPVTDDIDQGSMAFAGGDGPVGGGGVAPRWVPRTKTGVQRYDSSYVLREVESPTQAPYSQATGETVTLQAWVQLLEAVENELSYSEIAIALDRLYSSVGPTSDQYLILSHVRGSGWPADHGLKVTYGTDTWLTTDYQVNTVMPLEQVVLIACQVTLGSPSTVKVWINGVEYSGTLPTSAGAVPASLSYERLNVGANAWSGDISHVQVYKGAYTLASHQAQRTIGLSSLEGQLTSARVSTIAQYAGIAPGDLSIETGQSTMGPASWSTASPLDAMRAAEQAEDGILYVRGDGVLVFQSRSHRRNDDGSVTSIPKAWLSGDLQFRADDPVNDASVTRQGGTTARSMDSASIATYGTYPSSETIDVASDSEPAYRAQSRTYYYGTPRQRCPHMTLDLTWRSQAERATILGLDISSRIALTGMPSTLPPDVEAAYVEGWTEEISVTGHRITLNTSPVLGAIPGRSDTWWQIGHATRGQIDNVANRIAY